jgi:hypothetical protein
MVRYYGLYANAHRGKVKKAGLVPDKPPPPRIAYQELSMAAEDRGEYFSCL